MGFSALVPDDGVFNDGESDTGKSLNSLFMSITHKNAKIVIKCKEYLLYSDEVLLDISLFEHLDQAGVQSHHYLSEAMRGV